MGTQEARELTVDASVDSLDAVMEFVGEMLSSAGCSMKTQLQVELVVEEIFVNIANYAYAPGSGKATVRGRIVEDPRGLELAFIDGGRPYNPLAKEDPDTSEPLEDRQVGGMGIFLVKKNVDDISYEYKDHQQNILTIRKNIG